MVLIWAAMAYIAYKIIRWLGAKLTTNGDAKTVNVEAKPKKKSGWLHGWRRLVFIGSCVLVSGLLGPIVGIVYFVVLIGFMLWKSDG